MSAVENAPATKASGIGYINSIKHVPAREATEGKKAHNAFYAVRIGLRGVRTEKGFSYRNMDVTVASSLNEMFEALNALPIADIAKVKFNFEVANVRPGSPYTKKDGTVVETERGFLTKCTEVETRPVQEKAGMTD